MIFPNGASGGTSGEQAYIDFSNDIANPSAPASTETRVFSYSAVAGRPVLAIRSADDIRTIQHSLWRGGYVLWKPTTATAGLWSSGAGAGNGTYFNTGLSTSSRYQAIGRSKYSNVVTTANQVLGQGQSIYRFLRGASSAFGGHFFHAVFGFDAWTNGGRLFVGTTSSGTSVTSGEPSASSNCAGFCIESGDAGAISFLTRGSASFTKAATGFTAEALNGFEAFVYCAAGSSQYTWRLININTGAEVSGTATATLPLNTTFVAPVVYSSNAAVTPVNSVSLEVVSIYCEAYY